MFWLIGRMLFSHVPVLSLKLVQVGWRWLIAAKPEVLHSVEPENSLAWSHSFYAHPLPSGVHLFEPLQCVVFSVSYQV